MEKCSNSAYLFTIICMFISCSGASKSFDGTIDPGRNAFLLPGSVLHTVALASTSKDKLKNAHVLVYTKNGKGYVHDNIASAVDAIKALGLTNKFNVEVSEDPAVF